MPPELRADHNSIADQSLFALVIFCRKFPGQKRLPLVLDGLLPTFQVPDQMAVQIDNFHSIDGHGVPPKMNVSRASVSGVQPITLVGLVIADLNQPTNLPDEQLAETVGATGGSPLTSSNDRKFTGSKSLRRFRRGFCLSAWTSDPSALECPKPCADIRNRNAENR